MVTEPAASDFDMANIGIDFFLNSHDVVDHHLVIIVDWEGRGQNKAIKVELEKEALEPKNYTYSMGEYEKFCFSAQNADTQLSARFRIDWPMKE